MDVFVERDNSRHTLDFQGTVEQLLKQLEINPQTVLVLVGDDLVTEDEALTGAESVQIITVVSGG